MQYDRKACRWDWDPRTDIETKEYFEPELLDDMDEWGIAPSQLSCAFFYVRANYTSQGTTYADPSDQMWDHLCAILRVSEERSIILASTDREPLWRDLLAACPYMTLVEEERSRMGPYNVQLWICKKHERNSA